MNVDTDDPSGTGRHVQVLLRFEDLFGTGTGRIPADARIDSARLDLRVSDSGNPITLHRMLRAWADTDTWNSLAAGVHADGVEAAAAPDAVTGSISIGTLSIDVTASLVAWQADPAANFGWAILPTGTNGVDFNSAEGATPPTLTLDITFWTSNVGPVAFDDAHVVAEDGALAVPAPGLLANDDDPEGDALAVALIDDVSHGTLTLRADGSFQYTPHHDYAGPDAFTYRANDGSLDSNVATVTIDVAPVNDAPVLDPGGAPALTPIDAGAADPPGDAVADIIAAAITDPDGPAALRGIAVTAAEATHGTWQYSTDAGAGWADLGTVSETAARLLRDIDRVRFIPAAGFVGTATLSYRAWDRTSGSVGDTADVSASGGTTAFSAGAETATVTVRMPASETWIGATSSEWENGANWSATVVPGPDTVAVLDGSPTFQPVLHQDQSVGGLDIRAAGSAVSLNGCRLAVGTAGLSLPGGPSPTATLDLATGCLIVDYPDGGASPLAQVASWIASGCSGGAWDGPGITSSAAAAHAQGLAAVGVIDNSDPETGIGSLTEFGGVPVDETCVLAAYTWWGDINLDGVVDSNDYDRIDTNYVLWTREGRVPDGGFRWAVGDLDHDNTIDSNDYDRIDRAFVLQDGPAAAGGAARPATPAPAPSETVLLADRHLTNEDTSHAGSHEAISALLVPQSSLSAEVDNLASSGKFGDSLRADEEIWAGAAPAPVSAEPVEPSVGSALVPDGGVPDLLALSALDVRL